jgi:hypothetical protein
MVVTIIAVRRLLDGLGDQTTLVVCAAIGAITYVVMLALLAPDLLRELRAFIGDLGRRGGPSAGSPSALAL